MTGPIDYSRSNNLISTDGTLEPLNTLGTANTNMNLHPGFLDLINRSVTQNIPTKDLIPLIPPSSTTLDSDSVDASAADLKQAAQKLSDMITTFQAAYSEASNRNQIAGLLLKLGNQMISLINDWMTKSFDQMLQQLTLTLSLAKEIAKQQEEQAEETKKSAQYAAIGKIVSGAAGLVSAVGVVCVQGFYQARQASAEEKLTTAEDQVGVKVKLPDLEEKQVSIAKSIAKNSEEQTTLKTTLAEAEESVSNLTSQKSAAEEQLKSDENDFEESEKNKDLYKNTEKSIKEKSDQKEALDKAFSSYKKADMTGEQKTLLRNTLLANGLDPKRVDIDSILADPDGLEAEFFSPEIKTPIETAITELTKSIDADEQALQSMKEQINNLKTSKFKDRQTTLDELGSKLKTQQEKVKEIKTTYNESVKAGLDLAKSQKANDETLERTKNAIKTATKDQAKAAEKAKNAVDKLFAAGGPSQMAQQAISNITNLISGSFDLVSADHKFNADMINARITKLQAESSAASQYMSTSKSLYDNYLQTLLSILSKLADAQSSNSRTGG